MIIFIKTAILHLLTMYKRLHFVTNWNGILNIFYWIGLVPDITFLSALIVILSFFHISFITKEYYHFVDFIAHTMPFLISLYLSNNFNKNSYNFEYILVFILYMFYMKFNFKAIKDIYYDPFNHEATIDKYYSSDLSSPTPI